ncbi:hypothetical protein MMAD_37730 [Mycolicibacterium madagascariense]|uniref:Uncharacterized protein n=1 Tax=Mycolicibacterium madagascariense TaxID=212765 RepID=A0A7I7XJV6_9MYCO|nr:hypothetical protein MMAD_37730 [Mycolicibacterium madagascariense]
MSRRYVRNPDPYSEWVEEQLRTPRQRAPQNPHLLHRDLPSDQSTEFSFGPGPVAPHLNGRRPEDGGLYRPRAPRVEPPPGGVGAPQPHRRPRNEARGAAGDRLAR